MVLLCIRCVCACALEYQCNSIGSVDVFVASVLLSLPLFIYFCDFRAPLNLLSVSLLTGGGRGKDTRLFYRRQ